jgi:hypothetical protein
MVLQRFIPEFSSVVEIDFRSGCASILFTKEGIEGTGRMRSPPYLRMNKEIFQIILTLFPRFCQATAERV